MYKPGESGNPGGKPKGISKLIRKYFKDDAEAAFEWLSKRFKDGRTPAREKSEIAFWVLERYFGKAPQAIVNLTVDTEMKSLTDEEVYERIAQLAGGDPRFAGFLQQRGAPITPNRIVESTGEEKPREQV